jgi:cell division GTPase FtsZ
MRVLAIGLGAAGSRIVDHLFHHDRRSRICCMSPIAIDTDAETLLRLRYLPDSAKIHFPPIDPDLHYDICSTVDIEEVMTDIQKMEIIQIDAIMIFCGAGGSMTDFITEIVPELRKSFIEPIFAVVTLPCKDEGMRRCAKAADDIDTLKECVDAVILFDNETWKEKVQTSLAERGEETSIIPALPWSGTGGEDEVLSLINEHIARNIGLLLRAGEFNEEGLEISEVVLDAGEVLNTLKAEGFVAVGYAAEELPPSWLDIFDRWRSARYYIEGSQERAARIVALAKRAVYEDISVPCDLTSAEKALILIAGPSKELSMKGFVTVRKWIDRSISGLEMRSGDYPIKSTRFVGIIIMLSGLSNIPRLQELEEIREIYREELLRALEEKESRGKWLIERVETEAAQPGPERTRYEEAEGPLAARSVNPEAITTGVITLVPKNEQGGRGGTLVLPRAPVKEVVDITRMTEGGRRPVPKESSLSPRNIRPPAGPAPKPAGGEVEVKVRTLPLTRDGIIDADVITIRAPSSRPREGILDQKVITIAPPGRRPRESGNEELKVSASPGGIKDEISPLGERRLSASRQRPRETDPGAKKLKAKKPRKKEEGEPAEESDETIFWIS